MTKSLQVFSYLRSSFWFLPSLIVASSIVLAVCLIDVNLPPEMLHRWPRLFGAGAEGAREMLSTIASSMMTVVGITFSMTLVALSLASSQYTSRVVSSFMRSRTTQAVLGIFAGIFTYCLIVLRAIRSSDETTFVPSLAVLIGVLLAVAGIGILILFIHHIATSIQASSIISSIAEEAMESIDKVFPDKLTRVIEEDDKAQALHLPLQCSWHTVPAKKNGYLQNVDYDALLHFACKHNTIAKMNYGIGEFVVKGTELASLALVGPPSKEAIEAFHSFFSTASHRTIEQDPAFGLRQIVDAAVKALSPGINDTTTAVTCMNYLAAILASLGKRSFPSPFHYKQDKLWLITIEPTFDTFLAASFDEILGSAKSNVAALIGMTRALQTIATQLEVPRRREALHELTQRVGEAAGQSVESAYDLALIDRQIARTRVALKHRPVFAPGD